MDNSKILKELMGLRNFHKASLEVTERLIEEVKKLQEPSKPRQRQNLNDKRLEKYRKYALTGKLQK